MEAGAISLHVSTSSLMFIGVGVPATRPVTQAGSLVRAVVLVRSSLAVSRSISLERNRDKLAPVMLVAQY